MDIQDLFDINLTNNIVIGMGRDEFSPLYDYRYSEALAAYGRAAICLKRPEVISYCKYALTCDGRNNWGLPFDWALYGDRTKVVPAGSGFVSTTSDVLNFLLDCGLAPDISWLIDHRMSYGDHPFAFDPVFNAQAQALIVFKRTGHNHYVADIKRYLRESEYKGLWPYSAQRPFLFEAHQCMILEGLSYTLTDLSYNLNQLWTCFFDADGRGYATIEKRVPMPARFMALSALVFSDCEVPELAHRIRDYLLNNYIADNGLILNYPGGEFYVRSAAQTISALARIIL